MFKIIVNEINDETPVMVWISAEASIKRVIDEVCRKKGIRTTRDLRLSFFYQNRNFYLQNEECIGDIAKFIESSSEETEEEGKRHSLFSTFGK